MPTPRSKTVTAIQQEKEELDKMFEYCTERKILRQTKRVQAVVAQKLPNAMED